MSDNANILEVRALTKRYPGFTLNGVDFDVPKGYITGFVGPNGAGKTTTIKLLLGVSRPDGGTVKSPGNGKIGVVMDNPPYVEDWTVADVARSLSLLCDNWNRAAFDSYTGRFGLDSGKKVKELSRGMKVKLQMAAALSRDAMLLVLDEPTSGLDSVARDEICDLLREFVSDENHSVFFSTHITSDLEKTADFVTFMLDGHVVFSGSREGLLEKYVRVTGGPGELGLSGRKLVIGYREHGTGFEGMAESADVGKLPKSVLSEPISLDEIIIFMDRGAKAGE